MNMIRRFAGACKKISYQARARRLRIAEFHAKSDDLVARLPMKATQEKINAASTVGELEHYLNAEKEAITGALRKIDKSVGSVPKYEHWLALDRAMKPRLDGLDLRGFRWRNLRFHYAGAVPRESQTAAAASTPTPMYIEHATGRWIGEDEYIVIGGPSRSAEFTRVK